MFVVLLSFYLIPYNFLCIVDEYLSNIRISDDDSAMLLISDLNALIEFVELANAGITETQLPLRGSQRLLQIASWLTSPLMLEVVAKM